MQAREDYRKKGYTVEYINAKDDSGGLERMLKITGGDRRVPVIVEDERITIGYGGT